MFRISGRRLFFTVMLGGLLTSNVGCEPDMADQPRVNPLRASQFFSDGQSARPLVAGTVSRGNLRIDKAYFEGKIEGKPVEEFPFKKVAAELHVTSSNGDGDDGDGNSDNDREVTRKILERGQQRFNIFCLACHDRTGTGRGMVVQRGFPAPPSYHSDRLRGMPIGHFFDVITHGFGRMPDYASQVPVADRWAIAAYVRALQWSQHADVQALSDDDRTLLKVSRATE